MAGARLSIAPNGWSDEDCPKWLVRGLRIATNGCEWPQHKKATIKWQFGDPNGQMKKLWRGNRPVTPAKRKNRGTAINGSCWPKENTARQLGYHAGLFKNRGAAIGVSCRPLQKSRRGNRSITPANKIYDVAIVVSRRPIKIAARQL